MNKRQHKKICKMISSLTVSCQHAAQRLALVAQAGYSMIDAFRNLERELRAMKRIDINSLPKHD